MSDTIKVPVKLIKRIVREMGESPAMRNQADDEFIALLDTCKPKLWTELSNLITEERDAAVAAAYEDASKHRVAVESVGSVRHNNLGYTWKCSAGCDVKREKDTITFRKWKEAVDSASEHIRALAAPSLAALEKVRVKARLEGARLQRKSDTISFTRFLKTHLKILKGSDGVVLPIEESLWNAAQEEGCVE